MATPPKSGSKALEAIDALLAEALPAPASSLDAEAAKARIQSRRECDLCGAPELCGACRRQRSE